jgi:hypothetical protein
MTKLYRPSDPCPCCVNGQVPRSDAQGHMSAVDRCLVCNGSGYLPAADLTGYDHRAGSDEDYIEPTVSTGGKHPLDPDQ